MLAITQLVQLYVQIEAAHDTVDELGKLGLVEFKDVSKFSFCLRHRFCSKTHIIWCI